MLWPCASALTFFLHPPFPSSHHPRPSPRCLGVLVLLFPLPGALPLEVLTAGASHPSHLSPNITFQWPQPLRIVCILQSTFLPTPPRSLAFSFYLFIFILWLCCVAWPGIKPEPPALQVWSLNHWITREVLPRHFLLHFLAYLFFTPSTPFATGYTFFFIGLWSVSLF